MNHMAFMHDARLAELSWTYAYTRPSRQVPNGSHITVESRIESLEHCNQKEYTSYYHKRAVLDGVCKQQTN